MRPSGGRVAYDAGPVTTGRRGEVCRCQLPAWSTRLLLTACVALVICGNCVTLFVGHRFNEDLGLRWIVVCLSGFVLSVVFDTIKVYVMFIAAENGVIYVSMSGSIDIAVLCIATNGCENRNHFFNTERDAKRPSFGQSERNNPKSSILVLLSP